jgi:hypothetical protein
MRTIAKLLLTAVILVLFAAGLNYLCYRPYLCNQVSRSIKESTLLGWNDAERAPENWRVVVEARRRLGRLQPCLDPCCATVELHMIAAANFRLLQRNGQAANEYRAALQYDQRPEIYFNLGLVEVADGQREQGIQDLVIAGRTGSYWNQIEDEPTRTEVVRRLYYLPPPRF